MSALLGKSCFSSMLQVAVQGLHDYNTLVGKQHYNTTYSTLQQVLHLLELIAGHVTICSSKAVNIAGLLSQDKSNILTVWA